MGAVAVLLQAAGSAAERDRIASFGELLAVTLLAGALETREAVTLPA